MKTTSLHSIKLKKLLQSKKVATIAELKKALGTNTSMTVFRKLNELDYISSCSHSGKFYSLRRIAKFNDQGLWFYKKILFSKNGTLQQTIFSLVNDSCEGYTSSELEKLINLKVNGPLLDLITKAKLDRMKINGVYVYFSKNKKTAKQQELFRKESVNNYAMIKEPEMLMNELKASLILFFSLLDEQQRRIFTGLESLKHGHGGDRLIAEIFGVNEKTVSRGRKELLEQKILFESVRDDGGGRKEAQKKNRSYRKNRRNNEI